MTKTILTLALLCAANLALAQPADAPKTYDENATAESLGLERYDAPIYPIFPWDHLGSWGDKYQPLEEGIKTMAENKCTVSAFVNDDRGIQAAKANGLKYIYEMGVETFDDRKLTEEEIQEKLAKIDAHIKDRVESTKDDPDAIGYCIQDEPGVYYFRALAAAVAAVKKYAPGKLAYINLFPGYASTIGADVDSQLGTYSYREYLERYVQEVKPQFLSYDNYMVEYSEDTRDISRGSIFFTDLFEVRDVALKYNLPFWFIGSSLCILGESSPPTPARCAYQMYCALAAGAEGLTWFLYYPLGWKESPIDENGKKTLTWQYTRDVNEQMFALGTYLRDYRSTECGMDAIYGDDSGLPKLPELPNNVLKNVSARFSNNTTNYETEPKLMIGEFAQKEGENVAALAVNLNFATSVKINFELPDGYKTCKVVNPIDGSESVASEEDLAGGFWIIPGHGKLFVFEK
ncbi:MAG: hypothetical protein IJM30_08080 [Thermoguttaceae bacterium]|nr:hypothetical protein [Thermoguttaceae bacterium]